MGLISDLSTNIDNTLMNYASTIFEGVAEPIKTLLNSMALIALIFMAVNQVIQFKSVNYSQYFHWFLRYILIYSFATIWQNFHGIYNLFIEIPGDYAGLMIQSIALNITQTINSNIIDPTLIHDNYSAMDEYGHGIVYIALSFFAEISIIDIPTSFLDIIFGILILVVGAIFLAAGAVLVICAKVGFAVAIGMAPLAITMLMTDQTKHHFESWLRFATGFAIIPLLTSALMSIVLYVAAQILITSNPSGDDKGSYVAFICIMIAALHQLFELPTMASTLASASVAAVGAGAARAMTSMATGAPGMAMQGAKSAFRGGQFVRDAAGVANAARKAGAGPIGIASAALSGMRQSSMLRRERRDRRLADRIPGNGHNAPALRRYQQSPMGQSGSSGAGSSGGSSSASGNKSPSGSGSSSAKSSGGSSSGGSSSGGGTSSSSAGRPSPPPHGTGHSQNFYPSRRYRQSGSGGSSGDGASDGVSSSELSPEQLNLNRE